MTPPDNPNLEILEAAVQLLGPLKDRLVFLGGCATGLLVTDPAALSIRVTRDVDTILEAGSLVEYHRFSEQLRMRGFQEDRSAVLTVPSVHRLVKGWCRAINLKGNYGSHSLRKTWGYHQRVTFSVGLPELMVAFNHSTQRQTLDYLCVQPEEIRSIYENEL